MITTDIVRDAIATVMDPEIPSCSIADLGMIADVRVSSSHIEIDLLPTYSGCPALDVIREDVERASRAALPDATVTVRFIMDPPWTSDRMNDAARAAMTSIGISPPVLLQVGSKPGRCPYCGSDETRLDSAFGPTPCRTIAYCVTCRNPFEGFKSKTL